MQQQDRERSLACYGLHTCGEAVTRRVSPKAAGSPCHVIGSMDREHTRVKLRKHRDKRTISGDRKRGARTSLPSPVGCFSTSASYCNLYIIIDAFRHRELHFQSQITYLPALAWSVGGF